MQKQYQEIHQMVSKNDNNVMDQFRRYKDEVFDSQKSHKEQF